MHSDYIYSSSYLKFGLWCYIVVVSFVFVCCFYLAGETHRPAASHWQTLSHNVVSSTPRMNEVRTHNFVVIGTACIGICKSSYYAITITTTTAPFTLELYICFILERTYTFSTLVLLIFFGKTTLIFSYLRQPHILFFTPIFCFFTFVCIYFYKIFLEFILLFFFFFIIVLIGEDFINMIYSSLSILYLSSNKYWLDQLIILSFCLHA